MTPLALEIIIHYFYSPEDYRQGDASAPAVKNTILFLFKYGLLEASENSPIRKYKITGMGKFYVQEGLCKVPLPKKIEDPILFIIPEKGSE
jgi:hypothetical protein